MRRQPLSGRAAAWLTATGSLSARLQQAHPPLTVQRLAQGPARALPHERAVLGQLHVHGRFVLLWGDGAPLVWARSAVRAAAAHGPWQAIRGLGTRPLADLLFSRSDVRRSPLQVRWLPRRSAEAQAVARAFATAGSARHVAGVWRRHSVFWRAGEPLVVSEYFVPTELAGWPPVSGQGAWRPHDGAIGHAGRCVIRP